MGRVSKVYRFSQREVQKQRVVNSEQELVQTVELQYFAESHDDEMAYEDSKELISLKSERDTCHNGKPIASNGNSAIFSLQHIELKGPPQLYLTSPTDEPIVCEELEPYTVGKIRKLNEEEEAEILAKQKTKEQIITLQDGMMFLGLLLLLLLWGVMVFKVLTMVPAEWAMFTAAGIISITLSAVLVFAYFNQEMVDKFFK